MTEPTFKARVEKFWEWFEGVARRFYDEIEAERCAGLAEEVTHKVSELLPGFGAWEFSGNQDGPGHCFTLTGEGNLHLQLLAQYWRDRAPSIEGWKFFASRQAGPLKSKLEIKGRTFDPLEFWLVPTLDAENEKVNLAVFHPLFDRMEDGDRWGALFLFLDDVLGEYGTQGWIGEITFQPQRLVDSISIRELADYVQQVQSNPGWKKRAPGEGGVIYQLEPHRRFARGDILTGSTTNEKLLNEYLNAHGNLEDPLARTGADYVYVALTSKNLPQYGQAMARGELEEKLDSALRSAHSGRLMGGAHGTSNAYIDLLIFDGERSLEIIKTALRGNPMSKGAVIEYFAKEKRGRKIAV